MRSVGDASVREMGNGPAEVRRLNGALFDLAVGCTAKAERSLNLADPLDPDAALAVKNFAAAALSSTQAWMTATRSGHSRS